MIHLRYACWFGNVLDQEKRNDSSTVRMLVWKRFLTKFKSEMIHLRYAAGLETFLDQPEKRNDSSTKRFVTNQKSEMIHLRYACWFGNVS
ncbi:hypothetical protein L596_024512 [Steinernema carpocapsae]|uniref:Uncharacterized protein n=1 Tax=Steinernema carpocapsae TaxID=34508 RepID=A0A4U5MH02_STECR|nr:hypothetical protein L596_024512 [Steinernema carpocapsae]